MAMDGFFVIQAIAAPGKTVEELHDALNKALTDALATPPTKAEMARSVNGWKKSFYGRVESVLSRAQLLSTYFHLKETPDYLGTDLGRYTGLTAQQIHDAANQWLKAKRVRIDVLPVPPKAATKSDDPKKGGAK